MSDFPRQKLSMWVRVEDKVQNNLRYEYYCITVGARRDRKQYKGQAERRAIAQEVEQQLLQLTHKNRQLLLLLLRLLLQMYSNRYLTCN